MIKQKWVYDVQASALLCLLVGTSRRFQVGLVFNKAPREEQTKFRLGNKSISWPLHQEPKKKKKSSFIFLIYFKAMF